MQPLPVILLLLALAGRSFAFSVNPAPNIIMEEELKKDTAMNDDALVVEVNGQQYVRQQQGVTFFVKLTVVGNICYFMVPPMEGGLASPREKMMKMTTGEIAALNYENLVRFCRDDKELVSWLADLIYPERKLYKYLLLYNKRNPVQGSPAFNPVERTLSSGLRISV